MKVFRDIPYSFIFNRIVVAYTVPGMEIRPSELWGDNENRSD
ncbi:hypothetical protein [Methanospirillum hungatei]|jgi:hypothetical protein|nr:hypothetical protein [Methanospirillum hungatei]